MMVARRILPLALVTTSIIAPSVARAQAGANEHEPNNTATSAQGPLEGGQLLDGLLTADDEDNYFFYTSAAGTITGTLFNGEIIDNNAVGCSGTGIDCEIAVQFKTRDGRDIGPLIEAPYGSATELAFQAPRAGRWTLTVFPAIVQGTKRYRVAVRDNPLLTPSEPPPGPKVQARGLSLSATPRHDRAAPYRFRARGTLRRPAGSPNFDCSGNVTITATSKGRTLTRRTITLDEHCSYAATLAVIRHGRVAIRARFAGNDAFLPSTSNTFNVRAGR